MIDHWVWSKYLSLSYYEHPPMIAWLIRGITFVGGSTETALELGSQLVTLLILALIYLGTFQLYGQKASLITLIILCTMPYFTLGSIFLHITQPFLFFWILALFFLIRFHQESKNKWLIYIGLIAGLGALSKYIMLLFYIGFFIHILIFSKTRKEIINPWIYVAGMISLIVFLPVLIWNYQHDWISFRWQFDKATSGADFGENTLTFTVGHMLLFSPFWFIMGTVGIYWIRDRLFQAKSAETVIFIISFFPLIFFTVMSLKGSIADPHWVNLAYVGVAILLGNEMILRLNKRRLYFLLAIAIFINFSISGFLVAQALKPIIDWMPYEIKNFDYLESNGVGKSILFRLRKSDKRYFSEKQFGENLKRILTHSEYEKYGELIQKVAMDVSANRLTRIIAWEKTGTQLRNLLDQNNIFRISYIVSREYQLSSALSFFLKYPTWPHSIEKNERNLWSPLEEVKKSPSIFVCELYECQGDLYEYYKRFKIPLKYLGEVETRKENRLIRNLQIYFITP